MNIPQGNKKVKQKKRVKRKKRRLLPSGKKRGKKGKSPKKRLVLNTNAKVKKLEKQVAALKKKVEAQRKRAKAEPGTLLSPRSEAARKGWTTRRARQAQKLAQKERDVMLSTKPALSPEQIEKLEELAKTGLQNRRNIEDEFVKRLPEYLIRKDKEEFLVERKENLIMHQLVIARWVTGDFDTVAYQLAEEYDLEPYEIYGLWHGYELDS